MKVNLVPDDAGSSNSSKGLWSRWKTSSVPERSRINFCADPCTRQQGQPCLQKHRERFSASTGSIFGKMIGLWILPPSKFLIILS